MLKIKRPFIFGILIIAAVLAVANMKTSIRGGVNYRYRTVEMPLYVKWTEFLARHYEYARLAREITAGCRSEEEKALAILKWTRDNIRDVPEGMPVVDDHVLNIIIRGYGIPEQFQDVFTVLSSYAGMPAYWDKFYDSKRRERRAISFVRISGKWKAFDAYRGIYFRDRKVPDIYIDTSSEGTLRPEKQKPLARLIFEIRKMMGLEKESYTEL